LELPTDRPRSVARSYKGAIVPMAFSKKLENELECLSREEGATLFMVLLAAVDVLLSRYSLQEDIVVGTPIANRNRKEINGMIGFFLNTVAIRVALSGEPSYRETLKRVKEVALGAYTCQDLPFEMVVERLQPDRSLSYSPVFQTMFAFRTAPSDLLKFGEL